LSIAIDVEQQAGWDVVRVSGEIDIRTAPELRDVLAGVLDKGGDQVVVDLEGVEFLDSTALSVMVGAHKRLVRKGGTLHLVCTREPILRVLTVTGLSRVFTVHDRLDAIVGA
jgi:anti-sigma B factor antagonist